jgi:hypothetical protein
MVLEDLAGYIEEDLRAARLLKSPRVRGTPEACEKCERPLRAKNPTAAKQYPDRVAHAGYGLCTACYQYEEGGVVDPMPSHCAACKKPVRHRSVPKEERPEAVGYHGRGICQTCYRKRRDDLEEAG